MITSKYIFDILEALLCEQKYHLLNKQIVYLEIDEFEYTPVGVFVSFKHLEGIRTYSYDEKNLRLGGLLIRSKEIDIGAQADIVIKNGLIDYIEILAFGDFYPQKDPDNYELEPQWKT